jgi:RNA polymerase sigma-32 factor
MVTETHFSTPLAKTAKAVEFLSLEQERELFARYRATRDDRARNKLALAHLPLVIAEARKLSGFNVPADDLISEGNCGLMQAIDGFDPEKGVRLSSYARHWVRSTMITYVIRERCIMTIAPSKTNRRLFFGLNKAIEALKATNNGTLPPFANRQIADALDVPESAVESMTARLSGQLSLDMPLINADGESRFLAEMIRCENLNPEEQLAKNQEDQLVKSTLDVLNDRERRIICARHFNDDEQVPHLQTLAADEQISTTRVHQIEKRALRKITKRYFDNE